MAIPKLHFNPKDPNIGDIEIISLDRLHGDPAKLGHNPAEAHRVEFYCLIYITKGKGHHFVDFNKHRIQAGNAILIHKNQIQAFDLDNKLSGFMLLFTDPFLEQVRTYFRIPSIHPRTHHPVIKLDKYSQDSCANYITEIEKEQQQQPQDALLLQLLFSTLYVKLLRNVSDTLNPDASPKRIDTFFRFIHLLEDRKIKSRDASDYASQLNITYKTLNEICKLLSQQTAKQLIDGETILEAKRKLATENIQTQTLADFLGFDEVTNFVKYFKKHTGLTPLQFQKNSKS